MDLELQRKLLPQVSGLLAGRMGLHFPLERWNDLDRGLESAAREFGRGNVESCCQWLLSSDLNKQQIEILASHLTVGETYFFRDRKMFEALEQEILPELIHSKRNSDRRLRIWSAACCTGEEPYSVGILLHKLIPDHSQWNITILATDINPHSLRKAAEGVYGKWAFRGIPEWYQNIYFEMVRPGRFYLKPEIRKLVQFSYLNLAEDSYPSLVNNTNGMDLILCRNVLMYFTPEAAKGTIDKLHRSLGDGGWLLVSPTDGSSALFSDFVRVETSGAILYRKQEHRVPGSFNLNSESVLDTPPLLQPQLTLQAPETTEFVAPQDEETLAATSEELFHARSDIDSHQQALSLYQKGYYTDAEQALVAGPEPNLIHPEAMALMARICGNQGRLPEALEWAQRAISRDRLRSGYYYLRATILQELGAIEEARTSLRKALFLEPTFVLASYAMGTLALQNGKIEESKRHFDTALRLLRGYKQEDILPDSEGMTAGRLMQVIESASWNGDL